MKKYRRIEVNAFRRRVTVVSGEWSPEICEPLSTPTDHDVSLNDSDLCEPVAADSPEGQLLLVEAVRSLERRLSPEARAMIHSGENTLVPNRFSRDGFYLMAQSFYRLLCPKALRFARKEK